MRAYRVLRVEVGAVVHEALGRDGLIAPHHRVQRGEPLLDGRLAGCVACALHVRESCGGEFCWVRHGFGETRIGEGRTGGGGVMLTAEDFALILAPRCTSSSIAATMPSNAAQ
jgi:hypothetical protein